MSLKEEFWAAMNRHPTASYYEVSPFVIEVDTFKMNKKDSDGNPIYNDLQKVTVWVKPPEEAEYHRPWKLIAKGGLEQHIHDREHAEELAQQMFDYNSVISFVRTHPQDGAGGSPPADIEEFLRTNVPNYA